MTRPSSSLPYGRHEISDEDVRAVTDALRSPRITQGPIVGQFESALAEYVGARHAVAFPSGTAALHGAAAAAGLGPGDEAITSPMTFAASANCVLYQGADPRFVDIDATGNLDLRRAAAEIGPRTKAVVAVPYAGLPADLSPLEPVRDRVTVIEDAAHALGGARGGVPVGGPGHADMTAFSLHPVKAMTSGEGGFVTTESDELAERLREFRVHGISHDAQSPDRLEGEWYYEMRTLGFNYRVSELQAALGLSQLDRLDGWITRRNELAARYRELLAGEERLELPPEAAPGDLHAYHLFVVRVRAGAEARLAAFRALREADIGVQVHYIPVYRLPYYRDELGFPQDECPRAESHYWSALSLPLYPGMADGDVDRVVAALDGALG